MFMSVALPGSDCTTAKNEELLEYRLILLWEMLEYLMLLMEGHEVGVFTTFLMIRYSNHQCVFVHWPAVITS